MHLQSAALSSGAFLLADLYQERYIRKLKTAHRLSVLQQSLGVLGIVYWVIAVLWAWATAGSSADFLFGLVLLAFWLTECHFILITRMGLFPFYR